MNTNCVNCGISTTRNNTAQYIIVSEHPELENVIQQLIAPQLLQENDRICGECLPLMREHSRDYLRPEVGHRQVCVRCGRSVLRNVRFHRLNRNTEREDRVYNVITEWIMPRSVTLMSVVCHSCWLMADRASRRMVAGVSSAQDAISEPIPVQPQHQPRHINNNPNPPLPALAQEHDIVQQIVLPDYVRAFDSESRCFILNCTGRERHRVSLSIRKLLFNNYKFYVPPNNRLCNVHLDVNTWDFFDALIENGLNVFSAFHIQDMLELKSPVTSGFDFSDMNNIDESFFNSYIGRNRDEFYALLHEIPRLQNINNCYLFLAAYLTKLRTGEPNARLSVLFNVPRRTLEKKMHEIANVIASDFVPSHIGAARISRDEIIRRNLLLSKELFGVNDGEVTPVVIFDGTYSHVQKSSNYSYQKLTYSLHKYRNLTKPFIICCADGYIIDVLGPFPATTSDADIVRQEFQNDNSSLRSLFQRNDALILDRGFRDALPLLRELGYRTYVPASRRQGESQLSTLAANKSRAVTICRWVIEIVNGRFKRDYKLFRQDFLNVASKHLMRDFKIAAALINRFHAPVVDRVDAPEILAIINQKMYINNDLGDYIIFNNINGRRADFVRINANDTDAIYFPQFTESELVLISLGTYQIKQARSYYGEHIRPNGNYTIGVYTEVDRSLLDAMSCSADSFLLRGRIKSRHIGRKIYYTYILVDNHLNGREAIANYYCNCIIGNRTVGCCVHIMSIIWYLSYARHQNNVVPPAQFLDRILIT